MSWMSWMAVVYGGEDWDVFGCLGCARDSPTVEGMLLNQRD